MPGSMEEELLAEINRDLPAGIDWKAGAKSYLAGVFSEIGPGAEVYLLNKPFAYLLGDNEENSLETFCRLVGDFIDILWLLQLPVGTRILDVACGSGWLCHFLAKLGYDPVGIDVSEEFIAMARKRLASDRDLWPRREGLDRTLVVHDIEEAPLRLDSPAQVAVFEASLHHLYNPLAALRHVREMLTGDGLVVLVEGENRTGELRPYFRELMNKFHTLERPYSRAQLRRLVELAGFPAYEFFCPVNAWYSPRQREAEELGLYVHQESMSSNRCVCAQSEEVLKRLLRWWTPFEDTDFDYVEGFWKVAGHRYWSRPYSRIQALRDLPTVAIDFGSQVPIRLHTPQRIAVYRREGTRHEITIRPGEPQPKRLPIGAVVAGEELRFCSEHAFVPAWYGETDDRFLSFWLEMAPTHGERRHFWQPAGGGRK